MSVPLSMGPMLLMESRQTNGPMYHGAHYMQPGPPPPSAVPNGTHIPPNLIQSHHSVHGQAAASGQHIITSSMNRSQRLVFVKMLSSSQNPKVKLELFKFK
ncbi:hypothetical protein WUBG_16049 [Wuchereria bancrofti]|nr:hypothetical protein WUBG_16049 [Wuchereria bancrofti]